jgi:hypothetical protein
MLFKNFHVALGIPKRFFILVPPQQPKPGFSVDIVLGRKASLSPWSMTDATNLTYCINISGGLWIKSAISREPSGSSNRYKLFLHLEVHWDRQKIT